MIRFGPAGWSYRDWEGIVYPAEKAKGFDALRYLAEYFDTVEVNSTYYHPAAAKTARSWARRVQEHADFRFTAKLWKRFTHDREAWGSAEVGMVRAGMDPLAEAGRLGAILVQFPWSFRRTDENREWLDDVATAFRDYSLAVEVRHESWNEPEFFDSLRERGIGFVNVDQPQFDNSIEPSAVATAPVGYVRVHGRNYQDWWRKDAGVTARYDYLYSAEELEPWAQRTREIASAAETRDTYVVTNNHARGKAAANALTLRSMVEGRKMPAPPGLFAEYEEALQGFAEPRAL